MELLNATSKIYKLKLEIERQIVCVTMFGWMLTFNKCLFTTKQRGFLLILICETSQIFVWRNKAFIFFQKSDIFLQSNLRGLRLCRKGNGIVPLAFVSQQNSCYLLITCVLGAAAFSRCGNVFFPLRHFLGSWTFSAAGFFPASAGFFLPRTGFFPPRTVFSRCLQNAFFLLQRCFCAAARCFFCCFEFLPLRSGTFCWRVFPLRKQLFPAARRFFPAAKRVFFLLRTCIFRALREDKELENVESYTGRSPLVSWIAHGQVGEEGGQTLKQPSANEKLKRAAVDAATCFNGSGYKRERQKEEEKAEER